MKRALEFQGLLTELSDIIFGFEIPNEEITDIKVISSGRINKSYWIATKNNIYILQQINTNVFKKPEQLMANVFSVTSYILNQGGTTLSFKRVKSESQTQNYGSYIFFKDGAWRLYEFIDATVKNKASSSDDLFSLGTAIGKFALCLDKFDANSLFETIPDFHNTPKRLERMISRINAIKESQNHDLESRCASCKEEIDFLLDQKRTFTSNAITSALSSGIIPTRVSHNDPKLNNVLFVKNTNDVMCLIDLDTVMPGTVLYDFGDAVRYACNTESEESKEYSKVSINLEYFKAIVKGLINSMGNSITENEIKLLPTSAWVITYEQAIRFLDDHIDKNSYFKVQYDGQNLERAGIQIQLLKSIEANFANMEKIVSDIVKF